MSKWSGKPEEKSPDGTVIRRYDAKEWRQAQAGFTGKAAEFAKAREEVYGRLFGDPASVSHEAIPLIPHIDVFVYDRGHSGRKYCTLVTGGMSDLKMTLPAGAEEEPGRVELIMYCAEPKQEYVDTMRWLAHFPHSQNTWIGSGHTIPNGNPPAPFWGSSVLDTFLFLPTIVKRDAALPDELKLDGDPVHFLWLVPLTTPECNLKLTEGLSAILGLFDRNRMSHVFDPNRAGYV